MEKESRFEGYDLLPEFSSLSRLEATGDANLNYFVYAWIHHLNHISYRE